MDLGLRDRVVVVTGASSGIGLATCRLLIDEGADVVACARREGALERAVSDLPATKVLAVAGNVNEQSDMNVVVDVAMHRFGRLDGVACIAGRGNHGHALDLSTDEWNQELSFKISGITNIVRAARSHLAERRGRVVTITAPTGRVRAGLSEDQAWSHSETANRSSRLLPARALSVLAPWPAARPTLALLQFLLSPANAAFSGCLLLGVFDPADELVAGQWCDVGPRMECRGAGDQRVAEVSWKLVYHPTGYSRAAHRAMVLVLWRWASHDGAGG